MITKSSNPAYHIGYVLFVVIVLTLGFGLSWKNNVAAFFFICMLLPIVLGTSYFFNYVLVPRYFIRKKYLLFGLYSAYTVVVSLYLEIIVLMFSYIYLGNFDFDNLGPNISNTFLLAALLYLLVFVGSFLLMSQQIRENRKVIAQFMAEKEKKRKAFTEILSNRKAAKIPYDDIVYIESFTDYIQVHITTGQVVSKEKISLLASRLPAMFLRIHRSFIINKNRVKSYSYTEVMVDKVLLNIGRTYRKEVREALKEMNSL